MSALTVEQKDDLLKEMLPVATALVCAVRDRERDDIAEAIAPLERDWLRTKALVIALAAMVPDDRTFAELVLWTHGPAVSDEQYKQVTDFSPRPGMKFCKGCQEWWRLAEFQKLTSAKDGRRSQCRACRAEQAKAGTAGDGEVAA